MKILVYIIVSLLLVFLIGYCAVIQAFQGTTWGGWRPEKPEFILSTKELDWKHTTEEKFSIEFQDIDLDESYTEDTVIYMRIWVNESSPLQQELRHSTGSVRKISQSYSQTIANERPQKFIELSFENLWYKNDGERLKYTTIKTYLFSTKQHAIIRES